MTTPPASSNPTTSPAMNAPNYRYWQFAGGQWADEYDIRKRRQPRYHLQELMLSRFVADLTLREGRPVRVLELGCGVGRHLRHLSTLPQVEAYGFDQSPTMAAQIDRWAPPGWSAQRVRVGPPVGRLPYDDGFFDLAFTSETLVHVRPEDLPSILSELLRVGSRRGTPHVLHLEPAPGVVVDRASHDGCWNHDLRQAYAALGHSCSILGQGYTSHAAYRVAPEGAPAPWTDSELALMRRLETDLDAGFADLERSLRYGR